MKKKLVLIGLLLLITSWFFYLFFRNAAFHEKKCYRMYNSETNHTTRFVLSSSLPWSSTAFETDLRNYLKSNRRVNKGGTEKVYFIKETSHNMLNRIIWGDDEKYEDCTAEVNNIDFLASIYYFKTAAGKDTMTVKFYRGEYYYY